MAEDTAPKEYEPPKGAETKGSWKKRGKKALDYTATAKFYVLRKKEKPSAEIFSVSYVAGGGDKTRPVSFVFNGGPGASSAYLHMGALGPQRVDFPADGTLPPLPPKLVENESSWLAFTDLVFVDPVGTGFSRIVEEREACRREGRAPRRRPRTSTSARSATSSRCASSCRAGSRRTAAGARRSSSPGESYGGYRVGRLVRMLQEEAGIGLNGAVLISPALELGGLDMNDYGVVQWVDVLPTMAGRRGASRPRARASRRARRSTKVRAAAEEFAAGDYAKFLVLGASLDERERERILSRLADFLGLPVEFVTRAEGRVNQEMFARELLRDERKVVGFYDATITTTDPFPDRTGHEAPDATLAGIGAGVHGGGQQAAPLGDRRRDRPRLPAAEPSR